ncbi:macrolide 2'-phosphotransferase [Catenuloplanes japonicus]|uniref:macrolide 2'-phosphotransferase n=1 Tax=Catenuloplanes japonicus TaxID=33876 RepID=UPI0005250709|nr:macrolide 2'-phosphotransferase [Catenuloplanes japonicus]
MTDLDDLAAVAALAARHGIAVEVATLRFVEAGLDYRVAFAESAGGESWVLRIPRRPGMAAKIAAESRVLDFVGPRLPAAVPDWRVREADLIAYPLLPGRPGLTVDDTTGETHWHFDRESEDYARSLGRLIAALHAIDVDEAAAAGVPAMTVAEVRAEWRDHLRRVEEAFPTSAALRDRWRAWLTDDGLWPERRTLTHGELYPAHLLLGPDHDGAASASEGAAPVVLSVLDWTTARVGDPAIDFMYHHMISPGTFDLLVETYREAGGVVPERLAERCAALLAAGPINYGVYALETGDPSHAEAARAQLNP